MAKRSYDFDGLKKESVKAVYEGVCAICGCDDKETLHIDHWIAGNKDDDGVCLCAFCNGKKGNKYVFELFRPAPKAPLNVITHAEYKYQIAANREAFELWLQQFQFTKRGLKYTINKFKNYQAPY
jgi:hypothetical protein